MQIQSWCQPELYVLDVPDEDFIALCLKEFSSSIASSSSSFCLMMPTVLLHHITHFIIDLPWIFAIFDFPKVKASAFIAD